MAEEECASGGPRAPDLTLVVPVYNEGEGAAGVMAEWTEVLRALGVSFELRVYDDGSGPETAAVLQRVAREIPEVSYRRHDNRGHGPTILRGYREAESAWIFQTDSDGEIDPRGFAELWAHREAFDFLFGTRTGSGRTPFRRALTRVSCWCVGLLFGRRLADVNTPFRLMRRDVLAVLLELIPGDTFAPNVILSGLAARRDVRIFERPVTFRSRADGGQGSLGGLNILGPAWLAFRQTLRAAWRVRRDG